MEFTVIEDEGILKVMKNGQIVFVSSDVVEVSNFIDWKKEVDQKKEEGCSSC